MPETKPLEMKTFEARFDHDHDPLTFEAVYPTTDEKCPGWTLFKDDQHKTVAMIPTGAAMLVRVRQDPAAV